ncbi:uncharacterized protein A4U43_C03F26470 [Asparagus officinalis]|uniref:Uncharacterized protein n=1 Tax=Asparagus officinalis TaxID=4686 RepID=A0A5P1FIB5_ASPOF|nr:uncharacterized protein A4U43_C03F26470 [Asparagus officinalis]
MCGRLLRGAAAEDCRQVTCCVFGGVEWARESRSWGSCHVAELDESVCGGAQALAGGLGVGKDARRVAGHRSSGWRTLERGALRAAECGGRRHLRHRTFGAPLRQD